MAATYEVTSLRDLWHITQTFAARYETLWPVVAPRGGLFSSSTVSVAPPFTRSGALPATYLPTTCGSFVGLKSWHVVQWMRPMVVAPP